MLARVALVVLFYSTASSMASIQASEPMSPKLVRLEKDLRQRFNDLDITYRSDNGGRTLIAEFRTRKFMVHVGSKMGQRSREAHEVVGPSHAGFLIRFHLQDAGTVNQAHVPQTIREPYWNTNLNVFRLDNQEQVYVAYSYGAALDAKAGRRLDSLWKDLTKESASVDGGDGSATLSTLEGTLRVHPKFAYRFYLDGLAEGQSCGLMGMDSKLKEVQPGTRIRVRGILRSNHFDESAYGRPNSALIIADYIYLDMKDFELRPANQSGHNP